MIQNRIILKNKYEKATHIGDEEVTSQSIITSKEE